MPSCSLRPDENVVKHPRNARHTSRNPSRRFGNIGEVRQQGRFARAAWADQKADNCRVVARICKCRLHIGDDFLAPSNVRGNFSDNWSERVGNSLGHVFLLQHLSFIIGQYHSFQLARVSYFSLR